MIVYQGFEHIDKLENPVVAIGSFDGVHLGDIKKYDMIVMFSPNGVKSLQANFPDFQQGEVAFAALGSAVTTALENAGWKAQVIAPTKDYPSITDALDAFLKEYATRRR